MTDLHEPVVSTDATGSRSPEIVPVRHWGRLLAAVVLLVIAAQVVQGLVRNHLIFWNVVGEFLFDHTVLSGIVTTIELTVLAMAVGVALGTLLAIGRVSQSPIISGICWFYIWFFRGTPVLVQILIWYNVSSIMPRIGLGIPFGGPELFSGSANSVITKFTAALLGLGLNEAAYMAEIVRAGLISVDEGQTEAAAALGMRQGTILRRIVLPQAMRVVVPPTGNETISMLKTTALVSVIAATDVLEAVTNISASNYRVIALFFVASIWYLFMTSILSVGQFYVERRFSRGSQRALPRTLIQRLRAAVSPRRSAPSP